MTTVNNIKVTFKAQNVPVKSQLIELWRIDSFIFHATILKPNFYLKVNNVDKKEFKNNENLKSDDIF